MEINKTTLQLFLRHVIVSFKEDSASYKTYGQSLIGKLSGRNWGKDSVISITIIKENQEFHVPAEDIESMEAL